MRTISRNSEESFEVKYSPNSQPCQEGASRRPDHVIDCSDFEGARRVYNQLRDITSSLYKELKPDPSSIYIYRITRTEELIDPDTINIS